MKTSDNNKHLASALLAAQREMTHPAKSTKSRFGKIADLVDTINHVKAVFNKHGIEVSQSTGGRVEGGQQIAVITTRITHAESGEFREATVEELIVPTKANSISQVMGCAFTYHRRYQLYAFGMIQGENDTDGDVPGAASPSKPNPTNDLDL